MPTYSVHTAKSQDYQGSVPSQRQYGYVIRITPPIVTIQHGEDIEGIGWWPYHPPRRHAQHFVGWYRYKADALQRLEEHTKAEVVHEHERNTHHQGISTRLATRAAVDAATRSRPCRARRPLYQRRGNDCPRQSQRKRKEGSTKKPQSASTQPIDRDSLVIRPR